MTSQHPITPPAELVQQWRNYCPSQVEGGKPSPEELFAARAAQWGADQELEACCEWLEDTNCDDSQEAARLLRAARRPKPPSEKEQTLLDLDWIQDNQSTTAYDDRFDRIRRALEQLND